MEMKFEDIPFIHYALQYNTPQKRAFINKLKELSPQKARKILTPKFYHTTYEDPIFKKAEKLGISKSLIKEVARWIIRENQLNNLNIKQLP